MCCGLCCLQIRWMIWKNWVLKKRKPVASVLEVVLPCLLMLLMVIIRHQIDVRDVPTKLYQGNLGNGGGGGGGDPQITTMWPGLDWPLFKQPCQGNNGGNNNDPACWRNNSILVRKIGMVPDNADTRDLASWIFDVSLKQSIWGDGDPNRVKDSYGPRGAPYTDYFVFFPNEGALNDYVQSDYYSFKQPGTNNYNYPLRWAIVVNPNRWPLVPPGGTVTNEVWDYTIRANATQLCYPGGNDGGNNQDCFTDVPSTNGAVVEELSPFGGGFNSPAQLYLNGGFTTLQRLIDFYITTKRAAGGINNPNRQLVTVQGVQFTPFVSAERIAFPVRPKKTDIFVSITEQVLALFFVLVFQWPYTRVIKFITEEKENKIKEDMKMMGLTDFTFWLSWFLTYAIQYVITAILLVIVGIGGGLYPKSNAILLFFFFYLFMLTCFGFAAMVTTFFDRSKSSALWGMLVFFGSFFVYYAVNTETTTQDNKTYASLSSAVAFALGVVKLAQFESLAQTGVNWDNYTNVVDNFSIAISMRMMLLDVFLYMILALYLDKVLPSKYGARKPFYFPFTPSFWTELFPCLASKRSMHDDQGAKEALNKEDMQTKFEDVGPQWADKVGISIENLGKTFSGTNGAIIAVKDLSMKLYEGQILALLGHNGAGKTTTINMLTGLYGPTSGDAIVCGHSIRSQMDLVRLDLGVCPQDNVIFPSLTVYEHLILFAAMRGKTGKAALDPEIDSLLTELQISEKKHFQAHALSGGQKRKLCAAMAMIGDAKVVFLDEPTSGMDPFSRRGFWTFLKKRKEGRTIILTTHMMDEADQLGDRIAIMAKGQLQCCGSSLFLKRLYGVGYTMTCNIKEHADPKPLTELVHSMVPKVEEPKISAAEVDFRLPFSHSHVLPTLFTNLDNDIKQNSQRFAVLSYGISVTTLEEVFLKVDQEAHDRQRFVASDKMKHPKSEVKEHKGEGVPNGNNGNNGVIQVAAKGGDQKLEDDEIIYKFLGTGNLFFKHYVALIKKRFHNYKRDKRGLCFQLVIPLIVLILGLFALSIGIVTNFTNISMDVGQYNQPLPIPFNSRVMNVAKFNCTFAHQPNVLCWQWPTSQSEPNCLSVEGCCWTTNPQGGPSAGYCQPCPECQQQQINTPNGTYYVDQLVFKQLGNYTDGLFNPNTIPDGVIMLDLDTVNDTVDMAHFLLANIGGYPTGNDLTDLLPPANPPQPRTVPDEFSCLVNNNNNNCPNCGETFGSKIPKKVRDCFTPASPWPNVGRFRESVFGAFYAPSNTDQNSNWFMPGRVNQTDPYFPSLTQGVTIMTNETAKHGIPVYVNFFNAAQLRWLTGSRQTNIITRSHPFEATGTQKVLARQPGTMMSVLVISIGFCFIPASFVMFLIRERETQSKHQQLISGVSHSAYWLSSYTWDILSYVVIAILAVIVLNIYQVDKLIGPDNFATTVTVIALYGLSVTSWSYAMSFLFESPATGQNAMIGIGFLTGVIMTIAAFVMDLIVTTRDINYKLKFVYRVFPGYCFADSLMNLLFRDNVQLYGAVRGAWENDITGYNIIYMSIEAVVYLLLTLVIEKLGTMPAIVKCFERAPYIPKGDYKEDVDVAAEKQRLQAIKSCHSEEEREKLGWILCEGLQKVYRNPPKAAVKDFWLGVPTTECFGFLGLNGAGKSTVLSMLSGDKVPTGGEGYLKGVAMTYGQDKVRKLIGYCAQQDCLFELLTGREHLELFARIKGVPDEHLTKFVDRMLDKLSLKPWANEISSSYSGGNKRKLCVGIALIGNPPIVFLDEPSTGMDPASRRSMWDLISQTMAGRTVILTTHSMEECEALCSRIGIMVSGRLRCIGTAHHLKQRFGRGYQMDVTIGAGQAKERRGSFDASAVQNALAVQPSQPLQQPVQQQPQQPIQVTVQTPEGQAPVEGQPNSDVQSGGGVMFVPTDSRGVISVQISDKVDGASPPHSPQGAPQVDAVDGVDAAPQNGQGQAQQIQAQPSHTPSHSVNGLLQVVPSQQSHSRQPSQQPVGNAQIQQWQPIKLQGVHGDQKSADPTQEAVDQFRAFVSSRFPGSFLIEHHNNRLKFRIPRDLMPLGMIFSHIETNRAVLRVDEYSVSETTLEQIFLHFAKQQDEEKAKVEGLVHQPSFVGFDSQRGAVGSFAGP